MGHKATLADLMARVEEAIEREEDIAYDVAIERGQILANVAHMCWFRKAVAQEMIDTMDRYKHLSDVT